MDTAIPFLTRPRPLLLLSSGMSALGLAFPSLFFLGLFGLSGFFYLLWFKTDSWRDALGYSFVYSFFTAASSIWWFLDALPIDWLGIHDPYTQAYAVYIMWIYVAFSLALPAALVSSALWFLRINIFGPIAGALVWTIAEEARMWGFAIANWGEQSLMGPHFSTASAGYALAENSYLLQLASLGGLAILNFTVALGAGFLAYLIHARLRGKAAIISGILLAMLLVLPLFLRTPEIHSTSSVRIAVISTNQEREKYDPANIFSLLTRIAEENLAPDMIILPEGHGLRGVYKDLNENQTRSELQKLFGDEKEVLILHGIKAKLFYESTTRGIIGTYDKLFLMPIGEYAPYSVTSLFSVAQDASLDRYMAQVGKILERGEGLVPFSYKGLTFGALLCSDIISPRLYGTLGDDGAQVLIGLSNLSWFHRSEMLSEKTLQFAKVHAVRNRAYFINSVNDSPSFIINPKGEVLNTTEWGTDSVIYIDIPVPSAE